MKIVSFEAENYKRLRAVQITPDGNLVVVAGRNAQGKSSVLGAIWAALGGREGNKASKPIRDGEERARVRLDLGDIIVTRTWVGDTSTVKVESAEGAQFKSPQALLDGLIGKLSFDPLAFTRLDAKKQREALLGLVDLPIDLDTIDEKRSTLFTKRTDIGRDAKAIGDVNVDAKLPPDELSVTGILGKIREVQDHNSDVDAAERELEAAAAKVSYRAREVEKVQEQLAVAMAEFASETEAHAHAVSRADALGAKRDTTELEEAISSVEEHNAAIRANNVARAKLKTKEELHAAYDELTASITALDTEKATALAAATFPVEGLGFSEDGVTYQGVPFDQASSAEQIRVSLAMAIAANPKLRVVRIMDGSLLDDDGMRLIAEMAAEHDMQVWMEKVGTDGTVGVIIEDGQVAA